MKTATGLVFLAGLTFTLGAPSTCMLSPLVPIKAGDKLVTGIENTISGPCELILLFSNDNFLPVTFAFEPIACSAFQKAEIFIPLEVPVGPATFLWQCAGQQATGCIKVSLEGGSGNVDLLNVQQSGTVSCLMPTSTSTSLLTITQPSTTIVSSVITTQFATEMDTMLSISSFTPLSSQSSGITPLGSDHTSATGSTTRSHATVSASDINASSPPSTTGSTTWPHATVSASDINTSSASFTTRKSSSTTTGGADSSNDNPSSSSSTRFESSSVIASNVVFSNSNTFSSSSVTSRTSIALESSLRTTTSNIASIITIVMDQTASQAPACTMDH
ncbi:hypothetical protein OCU04_004401 [Sclerotinia nivalis]|uniref:Uncharacterized protein n=1 Tax=Sclerotinia nivalis TaxID=352851 RepID=A0A9X0DKK5_9HELO|nr:hypothetical protein OCU04_004401 [Sclerotinia nivalis]